MNNKNPLYVVKEEGNVVEEAFGFLDALIKKWDLEPMVELLKTIFLQILEMIKSYPLLVSAKELLDLFIAKIEMFKKYGIV
jgi:hypothetical protein